GRSFRATTSPSAAAPPTRRSIRRWSGPSARRTTCGCRSCGWSTGQGAGGASSRSRTWASPTSRTCRASTSWAPTSPGCRWPPPPVVAGTDPADRREGALLGIVPRDARKPYKMRAILEAVVDRGSLFELGARYGRSLITALARLGGRPVGVLASDPNHYGGGLTGDASDKLARFVDQCDQFHLPVVNLVDQPGFVIGTHAERQNTIRRGARALYASYQATVPWVSILVRKVYGVAGAGHGNHAALNLRYAWPSGGWGSLPLEGG